MFYCFTVLTADTPRTFAQKRKFYDSSDGSMGSMTSLAIVMMVALCSAHAQFSGATVDVIVHVPKGFLKSGAVVFLRDKGSNSVLLNGTDIKVQVFGKLQTLSLSFSFLIVIENNIMVISYKIIYETTFVLFFHVFLCVLFFRVVIFNVCNILFVKTI